MMSRTHTIVTARDRHVAAAFFADLLGLEVSCPAGPFVPVQVRYLGEHPQVEFGSGRAMSWDREIEDAGDGRTVYVRDPDGHSYEFFTAVPD